MTYTLKFHAFCGMTTLDETTGDRTDARKMAADLIRRRRHGDHPVRLLEKGASWEVQEPEDCMMVPDTAGILRLHEEEEDEWDEDEEDWDEDDWDEDEEDADAF